MLHATGNAPDIVDVVTDAVGPFPGHVPVRASDVDGPSRLGPSTFPFPAKHLNCKPKPCELIALRRRGHGAVGGGDVAVTHVVFEH